jgi:hypothetical protein
MYFFNRLQEDPPAGVSGAPSDNNIMLWNAVIFGYVKDMKMSIFDLIFLELYSVHILLFSG